MVEEISNKVKCCDCGKELDVAFKSFDEDDFCKDCCMPCECKICNCNGPCSNECKCHCCYAG